MIHSGRALSFWSLLVSPQLALAHSPIEGIGEFYNGLLHPVFVPAHMLLLMALGLFVGQQGAKDHQVAVAVFLVAVTLGLMAAWFSLGDQLEMLILGTAAVTGVLIAARLAVGRYGCALATALAGLLLGMDSAQDMLSGKERFISLVGSAVGIYLLFLYPVAIADIFSKKSWQKIGVRVVGSWIAASALLVLALSYSPTSLD
jgi:hydrogenase/urease accessory protein HupE